MLWYHVAIECDRADGGYANYENWFQAASAREAVMMAMMNPGAVEMLADECNLMHMIHVSPGRSERGATKPSN